MERDAVAPLDVVQRIDLDAGIGVQPKPPVRSALVNRRVPDTRRHAWDDDRVDRLIGDARDRRLSGEAGLVSRVRSAALEEEVVEEILVRGWLTGCGSPRTDQAIPGRVHIG